MHYINEYFTANHREYPPEIKIEDIAKASVDCDAYKVAVETAIKEAYNKFIKPHSDKNIIYSRTWGK